MLNDKQITEGMATQGRKEHGYLQSESSAISGLMTCHL
jgi:hypothetical protein